ncbi:glycosyltransferase [Flavisolibacter nicotianae]|uniref:glycosyltransferase n=1 Tax=Flavisolibacter nicotianae TaxID=2364882 RepID=UPI000EAC3A6A|nr:glycosyltransferase [Flavisolibacter nicotianae]
METFTKEAVHIRTKEGKAWPKVLFVIDTLEFGGAEQSLLENAKRFTWLEPVICHIYRGETLKPMFVENGIRVHSFNITKKYGFRQAHALLHALVKAEKPDLLVAYLTRSELLTRMVARQCRLSVVGTFVNDLYSATYNRNLSWTSKIVVRVFKWANRFTSRFCCGFVANSLAVKEANARWLAIPAEKITVINRGRNSATIKRKENFQGSGQAIRFVNVARLFSIKNHQQLILGFSGFVAKSPFSTLYVIGEGPMRNELTGLIADLALENNVFLLGSRNDVPEILSNYDCFVFPSLSEGFSGAIVEAMFAGLPVLASDIPPNQEAITHLETGYLFQQGSADAIEKALCWFNDNRLVAEGLAQQAYVFAKENFELEKIAETFESYLQTLIASQP